MAKVKLNFLMKNILKDLWLPGAIAALMAVLMLLPELSARLELCPGRSPLYTWLTCHLVHYTWKHFLYDTVVFLALGMVVIRQYGMKWFAGLCIGSGLVIALVLPFAAPQFTVYRGISGIDTALVAAAALVLLGDKSLFWRIAAGITLAGIVAKFGYETFVGNGVFVAEESFAPAGAAHLTGLACGIGMFVLYHFAARRKNHSANHHESADDLK